MAPDDDDSGSSDGFIQRLLGDPEIRAAFLAKLAADTARIQAATERAHIEAEGGRAMVRQAEATAEMAERAADANKREFDFTLAGDTYHRVYQFSSEVTSSSVASCIDKLSRWARMEPGCDIEVIFNSPGGAVVPGMALFDYLVDLRHKGHKLTTVALGHAASMAGILLQAGTHRVMGPESWLLIHEISFMAIGKIGEVEDTTDWAKRICERVVQIFAERSKMDATEIELRWKRKDWWLSSDECLGLGLVDEVR